MRAIFLDRDGTLNYDDGYTHKWEGFEFMENSIVGLQSFVRLGYELFVITNQSGIARGFYTFEEVVQLHQRIQEYLRGFNIIIKEFLVCPHHPDFTGTCECRKPSNKLIEEAVSRYGIDKDTSWMIGDRKTDMEAAKRSRLKFIAIKSRFENFTSDVLQCDDLLEAYRLISQYV